MTKVIKYTEWEINGRWYCNDVSDLNSIKSKWHTPARLLGISLTDYIEMLKNKYNAVIDLYNAETNVLIYHWNNYAECHKFVLWLNRQKLTLA